MPGSRKARKTAMVSMLEASSNLQEMPGENGEMFLWRTDFQRILQDDRKVVECHGSEVQLCQYEKWMQRSPC